MNDSAEQIKNKLDIVDFLKGYIQLLPAGKNFKALCPFHKEKTPSFMVSPDRQTWHCFGFCNTGGDIFTFLMRHENIEFFEALKILAEKAGIELRKIDPVQQRQFGVLYDINSAAKEFFKAELQNSAPALDYLKKRGLDKSTVEEFEIGFAPNKFDALTLHLINKGFAVADLERSGLARKSERGRFYDLFRGRIIFPIANHFGKTVGFTGRVLPEFDDGAMGKYVNSPESPIFKKSKTIYGFYRTKNDIRERGEVLMVEGQMDFAMAWQDGVKNIAATSGTALTRDHLAVLKKYADKLLLCFDADEAGFNAAERAIDLAFAYDLEVKIISMPSGVKDPAELVQKQPGILKNLLAGAKPAMQFYFERYLSEAINKKTIRAVLVKIKTIASSIDRAVWLKALAEKTGFSEQNLAEEMAGVIVPPFAMFSKPPAEEAVSGNFVQPKTRRELIAQNILSFAVANQDLRAVEPSLKYLPAVYQKIYEFLKTHFLPAQAGAPPAADIAQLVDMIYLQAGLHSGGAGGGKEYALEELHRNLKFEYLKELQQNLLAEIKKKSDRSSGSAPVELTEQYESVSKELHSLT